MFGRQNIGATNPFQQFGTINPLQQLVGGISPYSIGAGLYGVNPFATTWGVSAGQINPFSSFQPGVGINPQLLSQLYQQAGGSELGGQFGGQFPNIPQPFGGGFGQPGSQLPGGQFGGGVSGQWTGGFGQQAGGGVVPHILSQLLANPAIASDPVAGALIAQQLHASTFQQPPIRSLINPLQPQAFQPGLPVGLGSITGQGLDPSSAFIQAQLMSQMAANPYQQMLRAYTNVPWAIGGGLSPFAGQVSPFTQTGLPFNF